MAQTTALRTMPTTKLRCASTAAVTLLFAIAAMASARPTVSLNGTWQFRLDTGAHAETNTEPEASWKYPGAIQVPGCWDVQGFGEPTDRMRHHGIGVGWYRRTFAVPEDWTGKHVWLRLGGVHRSARVWIDGTFVGDHWGYPVACKWDVTEALAAYPKHVLLIAVDSRRHPERDPLTGTFDLIDYVNIDWGGIFDDVTLEVTGDTWIDDAFIVPEPAEGRAEARVRLGGKRGGPLNLTYEVCQWQAETGSGTLQTRGQATTRYERSVIDLDLADAPRWSPEAPNLLVLRVKLKAADRLIDERDIRFGLRRLDVRGNDFYLNDRRFFLRGYGDDNTLPLELVPPADRGYWRDYLNVRKRFGFNGVRHHSMMPTEAYLAAADEVGMLVQPELPIAYQSFFERSTPAGKELYRQVWRAYIRQMRNHPSVMAWCMGNELWNGFALGSELYDIAKQLDPTRPVIDSDGIPLTDRPTLDYLSVQFDEHSIPWGTRRGKYVPAQTPAKPVIVHEMSNLSTLPDPAAAQQYTGPKVPFWLHKMQGRVNEQRLSAVLPAMLTASHKLQAQLLKLNIETARLSPEIDGYHQWLFRDYWTQSSGFVDQFDGVRQVTVDFARQFNGPAVLLLDCGQVNFTAGETIPVRLFVSDFREQADRPWNHVRLSLGDRAIALTPPDQRTGPGLLGPWTGQARAPEVDKPAKLRLVARAAGIRNEWSVWVFPPTATELSDADREVLLTHLSEAALTDLENGAAKLLVNAEGIFSTLNTTFKPAWWHGGNESDHSYGKLFLDHPALGELPHEGYGDLMMASLLDNRPVVVLDGGPRALDPIVWDLDVPWLMRRKAYLFEVRVGKGKLLVSTLNLSPTNRAADPAAAWMLHQLLAYVRSGAFQPTVDLGVDWLRDRVREAGLPDPATFVNGFARVLEQTEETKTWHSYREDDTQSLTVRLTDGKQKLTWETAPIPGDWPHDVVTFAWTGGIGWRSEPEGGHFSLALNGEKLLDFPFAQKTTRWKSDDGRVSFHYVVKRIKSVDSFGVFYLTVPADALTRGEPTQLTVTATAANSQRWFGLNPYVDTVEYERW